MHSYIILLFRTLMADEFSYRAQQLEWNIVYFI